MSVECAPIPTDHVKGNELELQLRFKDGGEVSRRDLDAAVATYRQQEWEQRGVVFATSQKHYRGTNETTTLYFDSTGAILYRDIDLAESGTPECPLITEDLVPRIRNHENIGIGLGSILAKTHGRDVEMHLRTGTSKGFSACHDSIGVAKSAADALRQNMRLSLPAHLATQGIFSGAGLTTQSGMRFSQKLATITDLNIDYSGETNAGYATKRDKGTPLVEIRCNDFNLLDDATELRVGGSEIAVLVGLSPIADYMRSWTEEHISAIKYDTVRYNQIPLDEEGNFVPNHDVAEAIKFQIGLSETFLSGQRHFVDSRQLQELVQIAERRIALGDAILRVMNGEDLETITKSVDWAAKLYLDRMLMKRDRTKGIQRRLGDVASRAVDLQYDQITISVKDGEVIVQDSLGYILRNRHSPGARERAALIAATPPHSRAAARAEVLKTYMVTKCDWVWLYAARPGRNDVVIRLQDAARPHLHAEQRQALQSAQRR